MTSPQEQLTELTRRTQENFKHLCGSSGAEQQQRADEGGGGPIPRGGGRRRATRRRSSTPCSTSPST